MIERLELYVEMAPITAMQQQRPAIACRRVAHAAARAGAGPNPSSRSSSSSSSQNGGTTRRELLAAAALLPAASAQLAGGRPAWAAEGGAASSSAAAASPAAAPEWRSFIERDFSFRYPPSLVLVDDLTGADLDFPRGEWRRRRRAAGGGVAAREPHS